jgi:putative hydrolase of the HAD superfamily
MVEQRFWVFDLDDTLYDEAEYVRSALLFSGRLVARLYGVDDAPSRLEAYRAAGDRNPIASLWHEYDLPPQGMDGVIFAMRAHLPDIRLRSGAQPVLDSLRQAGRGFGIMTDGRSITQRAKLAALGCLDAKFILISEESGYQKPDMRCYSDFQDRFPKDHFGYVGDNPRKDFSGARSAGWKTIMLLDSGKNIHGQPASLVKDHSAEYRASSWEQIGRIIHECP